MRLSILSPPQAFAAHGKRGVVLEVARGTSIGEKRNAGARAVVSGYVASFDDDDVSLPTRLSAHAARIGGAAWLSASRKYICIDRLDNIVGFEFGRCYGAGMIARRVLDELAWPDVSYREDQQLYDAACQHAALASPAPVEADELVYVHRRHATNASAAHRESLWQGVMPLPLGGADAVAGATLVKSLLAEAAVGPELLVEADARVDETPLPS